MKPKIKILERCSGCGACAEICPVKSLILVDAVLEVVDEASCAGCRKCEDVCLEDAIRITGIVP